MAENATIETVNTGETQTSTEKTFTQSQMDAIIGDRLARERSKYADYDSMKEKAAKFDELQEQGKTDLEKANERAEKLQKELDSLKSAETVRQIREKVSADTKVPVELLTGADEETCKKQAEAVLKFAKPAEYPGTRKTTVAHSTNTQADDSYRELARRLFGKE